ncbi:MAG: hypothetical protein J5613_02875 [Alphaproteobacteria bacterium]|nr:hypothetical protein [Alphaproteobacteria bacterium]
MPDSHTSFPGAIQEGTDERARQRCAKEQYADDLYQRASIIRASGQNPMTIRTRRLDRMRRNDGIIASLTEWICSICACAIITITLCCIIEGRTWLFCVHKAVCFSIPIVLFSLTYMWHRARQKRYDAAAGYAIDIMMDLRDYRGFRNFDDGKLHDVLKLVPDIVRDISASNAGSLYFNMVMKDEIRTKNNENLRNLAITILQGDVQIRPEHMHKILEKYENDPISKELKR